MVSQSIVSYAQGYDRSLLAPYYNTLNADKGGGRISKQNRPILFSLLEHIRKCTELSKKMC